MAKAPKAQAAFVPALEYTAAMALEEASYTIPNVEDGDQQVIWAQIMENIRDAATSHKLESCHFRQVSGPIPTNHANWITIRNTLRAQPYNFTVTVRAGVGDIEVKWSN